MEALTFSPLEALKKGWALTKKHFFVSVGLLGLYLVLAVFCVVLAGTKPAAFRFWISATVLLLITLFFFIGFDKFLLAVARGEKPDLYASFGAIRKIGPSILLLPSVIVATGFVALVLAMLSTVLRGLVPLIYPDILLRWFLISLAIAVVPAYYVVVRLSYALYAVTDKNLGADDALAESWILTHGFTGKLILMWIMLIGINILGLLALGIGLVVSLAVTFHTFTVSYEILQEFEIVEDEILVDKIS